MDLLPLRDGRYVVIEVNSAVDFTPDYSLGGQDVFEAAARRILAVPAEVSETGASLAGP